MKSFYARWKFVACRAALVAAGALAAINPTGRTLADTITQWNFNSTIAINNAPAPSVGAGSATPVGMNGGLNNADILAAGGPPNSSDPGAPNNAWRVRGSTHNGVNNGWSGSTPLLSGAQFNASTAGYSNIVASFDINATDGSPRHAQFQYTLDGTTFSSFGALLDFNAGNGTWVNNFSFDLSSIPGAGNNPLFGFKLVSAFSPVAFTNANGLQPANTAFQRASAETQVYNGTAGNWRFDMVTISGAAVPEPSTLVLGAFGLVGAMIAASRRR